MGTSDACIAVNPSDLAVALLAADAQLILSSATGDRVVALADFYRLPGATPHIETVIRDDELITWIQIPVTPLNAVGDYLKLRGRASYEFASASVASAVIVDDNIVREVAIAIGGLGTKPWRDKDAERQLLGESLTEAGIARFCDALFDGAMPLPANGHKLALARGAIHRVLNRRPRCAAR
jgi:xanthine dehydrogenase YagS FAD-binding subunit